MNVANDGHLGRSVAWLSRKAAGLSGFLIIIVMFTIVVDVFGRYLFNRPLVGGVELNRTLLVIIVFFGLALTQLNQGHIRMDLLLIRASPKLRLILEIFALLLALAVYGVTTFTTIPVAIRSIIIGEYEAGLIHFPMWPARLLMSVGMLLFSLQVFVDLKSSISSIKMRSFPERDRSKEEGQAPRAYE